MNIDGFIRTMNLNNTKKKYYYLIKAAAQTSNCYLYIALRLCSMPATAAPKRSDNNLHTIAQIEGICSVQHRQHPF